MPIDLIATVEMKVTDPVGTAEKGEWVKGPAPEATDIALEAIKDHGISEELVRAFCADDDRLPVDFEGSALLYQRNELAGLPKDLEVLIQSFLALPEASKNLLRIDKYLEKHVTHLRERSYEEEMYHARFKAGGEDSFKKIQKAGDAKDFGAATLDFAIRMHEKSSRPVNNGVLVVVRRTRDAADDEVVLLKLDIHNPAARWAQERPLHLAPVRDLLDLAEGEFPKAAVYPDDRRDSDVMVVDENRTRFFLETVRAQQFVKGSEAFRTFTEMVRQATASRSPKQRADAVTKAQEEIRQRSLGQPLTAGTAVAAMSGILEEGEQEKLSELVTNAPISIDEVEADVERKIKLGGKLELRGLSSELKRCVSGPHKVSDGWQIVITTKRKPKL